ncbi:MAG: ATP-binding cassette domain-containing protein [Synergistaceae bacterium]
MSIYIENLTYAYDKGLPTETSVLHDVSLTVYSGEVLSIVGQTGSGKSTLAKHLNGLIFPQHGKITVDGIEINENCKKINEIRKKVGLVFQYPENQIFAETVKEELLFAPLNFGYTREEANKNINEIINIFKIDKIDLEKNPLTFSGGNKRKIAIASILAYSPKYIIFDEPTAGLDNDAIEDLLCVMKKEKENGVGIIHITHDIELALEISDRIVVLNQGKIVFQGEKNHLMEFLVSDENNILDIPPVLKLSKRLMEKGKISEITDNPYKLSKMIKDKRECL